MNRILAILAIAGLVACSTAPTSEADRAAQSDEVAGTIKRFKDSDPSIAKWFETAHGYAVFPGVGKGGMGIGGAYGRGQVFEKGTMIGYTDVTQASIGFQLGGQAFSELIFFKDKVALDNFTGGNFEFSANASAVAATAGAAATADYDNGVAVFIHAKGGLMYEASVGGQKFTYQAK